MMINRVLRCFDKCPITTSHFKEMKVMTLKHKGSKRWITALLAGAMAASVFFSGCGAFNKEAKNNDKENQQPDVTSDSKEPDDKKDNRSDSMSVAKSEHYAIGKPIVTYLFNSYYSNYRDYAAYQGLDVTKSLKEQYYNQEENVTWFDYFMEMTTQYLNQLLVLCEAAYADGVKLEEADMESVNTTLNSINEAAQTAGMEVDEYITKNFGEGVNKADMEEYLKLTAIANKYYNKVMDSLTYTDEDYEKYYQANKASYSYADFRRFNFSYGDSSENSLSEKETKDLKDKAKAYAEDLSKCKTDKEFSDYVTRYLTENPELVAGEDGKTPTGSDLTEAVKKAVEDTVHTRYAYEVTSAAGKWIFDVERANGDSTVIENANSYTVLLINKAAYRDETATQNVRHILFLAQSTDSQEVQKAALDKANAVYEEWKQGDKTEESFAKLATQYTEDTASAPDGGLYTDVTEGKMVPEFNDWIFSDKRKPGDTEIIKTTYGYHLMYYVGQGKTAWKLSVDNVLRKEDYDKKYAELAKAHEVTMNSDVIKTIEESDSTAEASGTVYEQS